MRRTATTVLLLVSSALFLTGSASAQVPDLSGVWRTQTGATFYVRQIGREIWWFGTQSANRPQWTSVAGGKVINGVITVRWVDVPAAEGRRDGFVELRLVGPNHLAVIGNPNNFLLSDWYKT